MPATPLEAQRVTDACIARYARPEVPATVMNGQSIGGLLWPTLATP
jgi:hypothetical protein